MDIYIYGLVILMWEDRPIIKEYITNYDWHGREGYTPFGM